MIDADHCRFARAYLTWCAASGLLPMHEFRALMGSVTWHEKLLFQCGARRRLRLPQRRANA